MSVVAGRLADPLDQLRARAEQGRAGTRPRGDRAGGRGRVRPPPAPRAEPAVRPGHRRVGASSGSPPCAGIIVFGSLMGSMFISQQYLQNVLGYSTLEAGAAFLPGVVCMVLVAPRSAKLVESHGARFTLLAGYVFMLTRLRLRCCCCGATTALLADRHRVCLHRHRRRLRRHTRLALADRVGAGAARGHGVGHRRPAARPRRRDHAVDLRAPCSPPGTPRRPRRRHRRAPNATRDDQRPEPAHQVVRQRRRHRRRSTRSTRPDHRRRPDLVPPRRRLGVHRRHHRGAHRCHRGLHLFPRRTRSNACSPSTTTRTQASPRLRRRRPTGTRTDAAKEVRPRKSRTLKTPP